MKKILLATVTLASLAAALPTFGVASGIVSVAKADDVKVVIGDDRRDRRHHDSWWWRHHRHHHDD